MAIPSDQGLLVVNLENCISNTDAEHVVKDECLYTVAVTPSACGENDGVIRIPVSVHCGERVQQSYTAEAQLGEQQQLTSPPSHFSDVHAQHYTRLEVGQSLQCLNNDVGSGSSQQEEAHAECFPMRIDQEQSNDTDSSYYTEIYNYLTTQSMPEGASDSYKKILKKRAYNYKIIDDVLFYGQKLPKKVIAEREQQREILRSVHIEESTGVHLGLKKMYMGISRYYFWKRLYVDVANFVRQCKQCSETADIQSNANEVQKEQQTENSDNPVEDKTAGNGSTSKVWQKVELKLFGPYPRTVLHNEFIITIADPFSHWLVARPISDSNDANHIADFVYKTFCTFGFAKCSVVDIPQEVLEMIQSKYEECISRLRDTLLTCGLMVPHLVSSCSTAVSSLHPLISENLSQCSWVGKLLNDFVEANHSSWDLELERFLFECCTTSNAESPSPFTIMFGRSPVSCLEEEDKENRVGKEKPVEVLSKRRRLQSSILQCRHCEDVFTSKISFRIHQRKHTEEARRQGILEGQEPHESVTEREKKLLKRTIMKRRQKLLKQDKNKDFAHPPDNCPNETASVEDSLYSDKEVTNSPSNVSDTGGLSLASDSITDASPRTSTSLHSRRITYNETSPKMGTEICTLDKTQETTEKQVQENDRELRQVNDINVVVYRETEMPDELKNGNNVPAEGYMPEMNQVDFSAIQLEVVKYPLQTRNETFCGEKFGHVTHNSVISSQVTTDGLFYCDICSKSFANKKILTSHIEQHSNIVLKTVHEPSRTYSCTVCSYVGHSANSLASHTLRNHRKKYKCSICDYSSSTQGGLDKHLKIYHNPENRTFACKHCSYCGLKRRQLLDHERTVHSQDTNKHICPVCKRSFRTHVLMKHHLPSHSDRHLYSCRGCSYTTRYRQTFHSHLKHSHPGESFKNLCVGPTDADFEAIINTALGKLESLPTYIEQNVEINYAAQISEERAVIEASDHFFEGTVLSEHSSPYQETSNCLEDDGTSRLPPLPEYETSQGRCSITRNDLESTVITEEVTNSVLELNAGNVDSDQTVTVIDGSGLTNDEVQTIVSLAGDLNASKQDVHHLVTFSDATKKTIFPLSGFSTREDKIHQVVTLVDGLDTVSEIDQHTVALINNISHDKVADCSTVTHISLTGISKSNQENFVILPLEDSKVAVIQRDIHTDNHLVLDDQTALLDLVPHQTEFVQQQAEENVNQITVYHLNQ
ncbi:zinc finger and BTB domain-containing protein 11-like isoform X3 [Periplaneta americana]|uniref:zinc finger and BTB domain-containing protein 11-like isoform X3 n=1 Tax=Periplaneta americana TaxID=6978 RepID=UPI0037E817FE